MNLSNTLKTGILTVSLCGTPIFSAYATVDFEAEVLPIFEEKCFRCHSARIKEPKAGILLDQAEAIMKGNDYGPIIVKMQPEESVLFERIILPSGKRGIMPPAGKGDPCTPEQIETVRQWIKNGAKFGNWTGKEKHAAVKPPGKPNRNSRLSLNNYGSDKGIPGLDLTPRNPVKTKFSPKLVESKAADIDRLVERYRAEHGVNALPRVNDRIFVRRAYLGIVGRTPTLEESLDFLTSNDPDKRNKLIDHLIDSEGYVNHWFHFWADLLKVQSVRFVPSVYYAEWIKQALRDNMPYDQFAYELVTATGMPHQNGATGWTASDERMAPDHMANTMQVFLGMQLQCAQCHDHPYDRWNQYEFQGLVSYYGGVQWNGVANRYFLQQIEKAGLADQLSEKQKKFFGNQLGNTYRYAVWEPSFNRWSRLPKDYSYADAKPKQFVPPHVIFGEQPNIEDSPREAFGRWITAEENTWFTKAIANRLWKQTMGVGLIEPVDEIKYDTKPVIPELLDLLEKTMKATDYNLKDFLRILFNTETWQLETMADDLPEDLATYRYEGRPLMRMTAEQMWDSLVTLAIVDPDDRKGHGSRYTTDEARMRIESIYHMTPEELVATYTDERIDQERMERRKAEQAAARQFAIKKPRQNAGKYRTNYNTWSLDHMTDPRWHGIDRGLVRAAELQSPAPPDHFIRQFGQSDRKIVGTGRTDPNVTQVLNMLNGPIHQILDSGESVLSKKVQAQETDEEKINVIFRSILTRNPTPEDVEIALNVLDHNKGRQGYRMILWALLNTREFMFIQ